MIFLLSACQSGLPLAPGAPADYEIMWSAGPEATEGATRLDDGALPADAELYVFVRGDEPLQRVQFHLDGRPLATVDEAPFGTQLSTRGMSGDRHRLEAFVELEAGGPLAEPSAASFTVLAQGAPAPASWQWSDIGQVGAAGEASRTGVAGVNLQGSGADIWGSQDSFSFVYQAFSGDGAIIARVGELASMDGSTDPWAKAGLMIRDSLEPGAKNAFIAVTPELTTYQTRRETGGETTSTKLAGRNAPQWLKLVREGSWLSAYASTDGVTWDFVGWDAINMGETVYVGVAVTSHEQGVLASASFDGLRLGAVADAGPTPAEPAPGLSGIGFLGDSNTELYYLVPGAASVTPEVSEDYRYSTLVGNALDVETSNYGRGGWTTAQFLSDAIMHDWKTDEHAYYLITFGLNDAKEISPEAFKMDTRALIGEVRSIGAVPVLVTNVSVDYPEHYSYDRNATIRLYDDQYRALARELGVHLIDVHQTFAAMNASGDWDTRIRFTGDAGPIVRDDSQDAGKGVNWFTNIHYNVHGSETVAQAIISYFREHGFAP